MISIADLTAALRAYEPERVYIFGSVARKESDDLSDLDLVIIKRTQLPFFRRLQEVSRLLPASAGVDVLVYTPEEFEKMLEDGNAFAWMISEEGQLIYAGPAES